jgi:hypothetical protein
MLPVSVRRLVVLALLGIASTGPARGARFEEVFTGFTMRLELRQLGEGEDLHLSVERLRAEPLWPGSRSRLLDPTGRGELWFEVLDLATGRPLYSRGHASPHDAGSSLHRSFRFPEPREPFRVRLSRRRPDRSLEEIWSGAFDPRAPLVDRSEIEPRYSWTLVEHGAPLAKVDLLFLGEGYTVGELPRYHADVGRLAESLLSGERFAAHRSAFNVRVIDTPSASSGLPPPASGAAVGTALGVFLEASASGGDRLRFDESDWREVAAAVPYDFVVILVNSDRALSTGSYQELAGVAASSPVAASLLAREFELHFAAIDGVDPGPSPSDSGEPSEVVERVTRLYTQ